MQDFPTVPHTVATMHEANPLVLVVDDELEMRAKVDQGFDKKLIQTIRGVGYSVRD